MKKISCILVLFSAVFVHAQVESLAGHSYFRDASKKPGFKIAVFPSHLPKDTTQVSFRDKLKKHFMDAYLFEVHEKNVNLYLSPVVNFQAGQDWLDEGGPTLYQNTRGIYVKGTLLKNFSFATTFVENQARFSNYENNFISSHGEFYPNASTVLQQLHKVIRSHVP